MPSRSGLRASLRSSSSSSHPLSLPPSFLPPRVPLRLAPYLEVPLEAARRALVLRRRVQRRPGRGRAAVRSRVPGTDALRPARGLRPRRGAPEAPVEPRAAGREAAAVRPGPVAVGRRVVGAPVAPRRGRQGSSAGGRAPEAAARVGRCRCAESRPVHGREWRRRERNLCNGGGAASARFSSPASSPPGGRAAGSGLQTFRGGRARCRPSHRAWKREAGERARQPHTATRHAEPEGF